MRKEPQFTPYLSEPVVPALFLDVNVLSLLTYRATSVIRVWTDFQALICVFVVLLSIPVPYYYTFVLNLDI